MFWTLIGIPALLPRSISLIDTVLRKTAGYLKDRKRADEMKDPVVRTMTFTFPIVVERNTLDRTVAEELGVRIHDHPAVAMGQRLMSLGLVKRCDVCDKYYLSKIVDVGRCHLPKEQIIKPAWNKTSERGTPPPNGG